MCRREAICLDAVVFLFFCFDGMHPDMRINDRRNSPLDTTLLLYGNRQRHAEDLFRPVSGHHRVSIQDYEKLVIHTHCL